MGGGGGPKIRGTSLGVPIMRTRVFGDLYWGSLISGNYHVSRAQISMKKGSEQRTQVAGLWKMLHGLLNKNTLHPNMRGCQNYDPFLRTLKIRCRIIIEIPKGTAILSTTHRHHRLCKSGLSSTYVRRSQRSLNLERQV